LEEHPDEATEMYEEKKKSYEERIRPVMTKLYESSGVGQTESAGAGEEVD
jgi:hypothetical protein